MSSERSIVGLSAARLRATALQAVLAAAAVLLASLPAFAQNAYVPNLADHTVSVIDTSTGTVTATIDLNNAAMALFPVGVAVNGSGTRAYVASACDDGLANTVGIDDPTPCPIGSPGEVSVIDTSSNTVIAMITIPHEPLGVAVSADETRLYVTNACIGDCLGVAPGGAVSVIDTASNTVIGNIDLPDVFLSSGIAVSEDGSRLYVASVFGPSEGTVSVIDTAAKAILTAIDVPAFADGLVLSPTRPRLYVTSVNGDLIVIDTATNMVIKDSLSSHNDYQAGGFGLAVKPDGTRLYAYGFTEANGNGIAVIDTTDDALNLVTLAPAPSSGEVFFPVGFTVHPDGSRLYATNFLKLVFSCSDNGQPCTDTDKSMCGDPTTATCDSSPASGDTVSVLDTATNTFSPDITVGTAPTAFGQFISPGICNGVSLWAYLGGATATPAAGGTYDWTVTLEAHACQAVSNVKVQGGTNGWTNPAVVGTATGTTSTKSNKKNQVITWSVPSLTAGQTATLTLSFHGTIPAGDPSGTVKGLIGAWSATGGATAGPINVTVQ